MSTLLVTTGKHVGRRYNLGERTRIGRAADNEIVVSDHLVSRYHAEIRLEAGQFVIHDLGSKNGFLVNGLPLASHPLREGDRLQVGETTFDFQASQPLRAARFSDISIGLDAQAAAAIRVLDREAIPPAPATRQGELLDALGRLFECDSEALPDALNAMLRQLLELFGATAGSLLLRTSSGDATPLVAVAPGGQDAMMLPREAVGRALSGHEPVLASIDSGSGPRARLRARKALLVPLVQRDRVFGVLHLERPHGREFAAEDVSQFQILARLVAGVIRHAIQRDQLVFSAAGPAGEPFIGVSEAARAIREQVRRIAASDATVLLTGETGTGKELLAHMIHAAGARAAGPFVAIDCSAISPALMESEMFGHEAGAFTGADRLKRGRIEMAEGGTLFLDEIGELLPDLQPKLLRFIEELSFYRVGGVRPFPADVRLIAATNRDLNRAVADGRFREDLLYRLKVMPLRLPPLRDRPEDVRPLVEHFAPRLAARVGRPFLGLVDETWTLLERYPWPGNVRELRHGLERALILSDDGILRPEQFQLTLPAAPPEPTTDGRRSDRREPALPPPAARGSAPPPLAQVEAETIRRALRYAGGNRQHAARILQIHRNTLAKKIQDYRIDG
jgi:DNA-binding NtrC family response regulator